jgi:hypothetical protein
MKPLLIAFVLVCALSARAQTNLPAAVGITNTAPQPPVVSNAPANSNGNLSTSTNSAPPIDWSKYVAVIVSILALGYTILKDIRTNKRMEKIEKEQEREKQEAANRRAKASAPYFTPLGQMFSILYEDDGEGGMGAWTWANVNVLSPSRKEMPNDAPEKTPVILPLDNSGKGARRIQLSGDISEVELKREPEMRDAHGIIFLKYPYSPSEHGKTQKVVLTFETEDGLELTHTYETRHGFFEFHRIDPK